MFMKIKMLETVYQNRMFYRVGSVHEVEPSVGYSFGNSCVILESEQTQEPKPAKIKKAKKKVLEAEIETK